MLLDDIRTYLVAQGIAGGSTGWPIYEGFMPDDQDQMIGLFETGGYPADTLLRENARVTFQVRMRSSEFAYASVRSKWEAVFAALQDAQETTGSPKFLVGYTFIQALQVAPLLFNDSKKRPNATVNFRVLKAR